MPPSCPRCGEHVHLTRLKDGHVQCEICDWIGNDDDLGETDAD